MTKIWLVALVSGALLGCGGGSGGDDSNGSTENPSAIIPTTPDYTEYTYKGDSPLDDRTIASYYVAYGLSYVAAYVDLGLETKDFDFEGYQDNTCDQYGSWERYRENTYTDEIKFWFYDCSHDGVQIMNDASTMIYEENSFNTGTTFYNDLLSASYESSETNLDGKGNSHYIKSSNTTFDIEPTPSVDVLNGTAIYAGTATNDLKATLQMNNIEFDTGLIEDNFPLSGILTVTSLGRIWTATFLPNGFDLESPEGDVQFQAWSDIE
ncbi:hypothetical protein [Vibrio litoralis]|uniref:hypothetical protein n=1 Tax=Vibrio litoralis TaxID=335972 RepID=UPI000407116D|nr:hypothetical protein [Vibrio litoralis]